MSKLIPGSVVKTTFVGCQARSNGSDGFLVASGWELLGCLSQGNTGKAVRANAQTQVTIQGGRYSGDVFFTGVATAFLAVQMTDSAINGVQMEGSSNIELTTQKVSSFEGTCQNIVLNDNVCASGNIKLNDPNALGITNGPVMRTGNKATLSTTGTWTTKDAGNSWN